MKLSRAQLGLFFGLLLLSASCGDSSTANPNTDLPAPTYILRWPFHPDQEGVEMYQTYGQAEGQDSISIHLGLDIHAPAGTPVYAPIDGIVAAVFDEGFNPWVKGFAIHSLLGDDDFITQFLHLESSSIQFALGDRVRVGDLMGELVEWPSDLGYLPHLHIGVGDGKLFAASNGPDASAAMLKFTYNANPLQYLMRERDDHPPKLVPTASGDPFDIRGVEKNSAGNWVHRNDAVDLNNLNGVFDLDVSVRDSIAPGTRFALAPRTVRFEIEQVEAPQAKSSRAIQFAGVLSGDNQFPASAYVDIPRGPGPDARFVFHYMSMRPLDADPKATIEPTPLDTSEFAPGHYRVSVYAGDLENNVSLGEMTVRIVSAAGR